jgi:cell division protein FtsQ
MSQRSTHIKTFFGIAISLLIAAAAVYAGLWIEKNTVIEEIRFEGNNFTADSLLLASIESPVGLPADSVSYGKLFGDLEALPYVKRAGANMSYRGALTLLIDEREPIALLVDDTKHYYLAEGGSTLPVIPGKAVDVPIVYGFNPQSVNRLDSLESYRTVERFLIAAKSNEFSWISISEVMWDPEYGVVALGFDGDVRLLFGDDEFDSKLRNWEVFYTRVAVREGIEAFKRIDFRFSDQIITRGA